MTDANVRALAASATVFNAGEEQPQPLMREAPPANEFPVDAMPPTLARAAVAIHDKIQCPLSICAQSVLGGAALVVQGQRDIELPIGQTSPASLYLMSIAESGERKSATDTEALRGIKGWQKQAIRDHREKKDEWSNTHSIWKRAKEDIFKNKELDAEGKAVELAALGPEPEKPMDPLVLPEEPTFEGLCKHYNNCIPSVGMFSTEGGQMIGGHSMAEENKLKTSAGFSKLWDGEPFNRVRAGDEVTTYYGKRFSVHLMAQPLVVSKFIADPVLKDQGLLSRFLMVAPESAAGTRFSRPVDSGSELAIRTMNNRMEALMETPLPLSEKGDKELEPPVLAFDRAAQQMWFSFHDHVEHQLSTNGPMTPIKSLANKLPEHAARLSAVMAFTENQQIQSLSGEHLERGIALAQFYANEALRLNEIAAIDVRLHEAQRLLDWIHERGLTELHVTQIYQLGPPSLREKKRAMAALAILTDHGHLVPYMDGHVIDGSHRREAWRVVRGAAACSS